jgi:hypothetical protein
MTFFFAGLLGLLLSTCGTLTHVGKVSFVCPVVCINLRNGCDEKYDVIRSCE